jgi:8-oxo-dGTP pyrophosphatase MutT (NUDIX family)
VVRRAGLLALVLGVRLPFTDSGTPMRGYWPLMVLGGALVLRVVWQTRPHRWAAHRRGPLRQRTAYDNRWVRVELVEVQTSSGARFEHHVVHLGRIAIALIVNEREEVLMLYRHRFAVDQWGYELLGGLVEDGEDPAATAAREALEESGWQPVGQPEPLISFEPLPGQVTAPIEVFLWRDARQVGQPTDLDEQGRLEWVPLASVPTLAGRGQLLGAGTLVALLYYLTRAAQPTS